MHVRLRVLEGSNSGREVPVSGGTFLIGRGEECQLRPKSEAVSRNHCALIVTEREVVIRDFSSKNGTYVNEQRIEGDHVLHPGDHLTIGPLQFEVLIERGLASVKRPVVRDVKEAVARTADADSHNADITSWLEEGDDTDQSTRVAAPDTRQFRIDDTANVSVDTKADALAESPAGDEPSADSADDEKKRSRWKKSEPGKLPPLPKDKAADTRQAAAETLRRFFNRR